MAGSRVLVVEDEPEMLEIIRVNLEQSNYEVVQAGDGVEAFLALDREGVDAVILDLNLPGMSGFRFLRLLRRDPRWREIPTVVVTALDFEEAAELANERVEGFITKPFQPTQLVDRVRFALSRVGSHHVIA